MTNRVYAMEFLFLLQCTLAYLAELFLIVPAPNVLRFVFLFFVKHCFSPPMRKIPSAIIFTSRLGRRHKSSQRGGGGIFFPASNTDTEEVHFWKEDEDSRLHFRLFVLTNKNLSLKKVSFIYLFFFFFLSSLIPDLLHHCLYFCITFKST